MIKVIAKLFKALNANVNPGEIAHAFSCGILLGFMPKNNVFWYMLFIFILFIRINKPMYLIITFLASCIAPWLDSLFDAAGYAFLTLPALSDFFAALIEIPFVGFTKFNNSLVMGSFLCGLAFYIPAYFIGRLFVFLWRRYITAFVRKTKITKVVARLPLVNKIASLVGEE